MAKHEVVGHAELPLRCVLTEVELYDRREELVKATARRGRLDQELEAWKAQKKADQKVLEGEVTVVAADCVRLAQVITDGAEQRPTEVEYQLVDGQVNTVRMDTGDIVSSRPAHPHELQRPLEIPGAEPETEHTHRDDPPVLEHEASHPDGEEPPPPPPRPSEPRDIDGVRPDPDPDLDDAHDIEWGD